MTLSSLCAGMPRVDADADLKRRGAEVEAWLRRFRAWGRRPSVGALKPGFLRGRFVGSPLEIIHLAVRLFCVRGPGPQR